MNLAGAIIVNGSAGMGGDFLDSRHNEILTVTNEGKRLIKLDAVAPGGKMSLTTSFSSTTQYGYESIEVNPELEGSGLAVRFRFKNYFGAVATSGMVNSTDGWFTINSGPIPFVSMTVDGDVFWDNAGTMEVEFDQSRAQAICCNKEKYMPALICVGVDCPSTGGSTGGTTGGTTGGSTDEPDVKIDDITGGEVDVPLDEKKDVNATATDHTADDADDGPSTETIIIIIIIVVFVFVALIVAGIVVYKIFTAKQPPGDYEDGNAPSVETPTRTSQQYTPLRDGNSDFRTLGY